MQGQCLCKSVTVTMEDKTEFDTCHCGMCRRWGGGPFFGIHADGEIEFSGEASIQTYSSSEWAERAFCKNCGTHIYYKLTFNNQYILAVGLFQEKNDFVFKEQIFIDRKPEFYSFSNETNVLTEKQVFDKYAQ